MPASTRPHRPERCCAEAWLIGSIGSRCTLVRADQRLIRARPVSITAVMPGTVSDVSATLVASTTRRRVCRSKTRCCSAAESRENSGTMSKPRGSLGPALEGVGGVADLPLAGQEHEDVAVGVAHQLVDRVLDRLGLVALDPLALLVVVRLLEQRAVAHLHRVGPPGDLDDGSGSPLRIGEVLGEPFGVDRRGGDHDLEVGTARQQPLEVAEDEVDVEAALVRLVDDQRVVAPEIAVVLQLGEQDAVGHHLDPALLRRTVREPDLVADGLPQLAAELLGDPLRDAARGDPAWLGVPDHAATLGARLPTPQGQRDLRQLRGLPGPGLAGHDHDLVVLDRLRDVVTTRGYRQVGREVDTHSPAILPGAPGLTKPGGRSAGGRRLRRGGRRGGLGAGDRGGIIPGARLS